MLVGQREKSQKYFDLSCSNLGVMNFQKWELFSGSPGNTFYISLYMIKLDILLCTIENSPKCINISFDSLNLDSLYNS